MTPHRQPAPLFGSRPGRGQALEVCRTRLVVAGIVFATLFAVVGLRVLTLAAPFGSGEAKVARAHTGEGGKLRRADIVDRNGKLLATTLPTASLYADPGRVDKPARLAKRLSAVLPDKDRAALEKRLRRDKRFVWIKRELTPRQHDRINRLGSPALGIRQEPRRYYPQGGLTAHLVGFTDIDGRGLAGVEKAFGETLRERDEPLRLSLDVRVQHALSEELRAAMTRFDAKGAAGVVMDADTGELVALSSLPAFDPDAPGSAPDHARFNRTTQGVYEMGSVFKVFSTAAALDSGAVRISDHYGVEEPVKLAGYTVRDFHHNEGELTVPEIFMKSSNIGTVKMTRAAGAETLQATLADLGLTRRSGLRLPSVSKPMVPDPWKRINAMTASYGHGIAVTPVSLTAAVAATVNGGTLPRPTVRADADHGAQARVLSRATSATMRQMMRLVVAYGTGSKARADGYRVGGKTGTADKVGAGGYSTDARVASFAGAFPMDDPEYVIFALVDEPKPQEDTFGYATGGWVAAPAVRRVVERIGPMLGVRPENGLTVPEQEDNPLLRRAKRKDVQVAAR
ncbi:cell division protein FtsI (penicillin-binding protein 3) [Limimonas halophila]|uniref:Cell division protein FtsI (Penicillin-binding protein 3) n=1 Tax=Limimonas halophila TaxID=1082479 RepID=A0A1G7U851_9PROT|nr:penicillin-binding protein 2 [Limimonas halophila]SDG42920.1 cell division protein FtsI (penicillin-binding protein 3) [Limimonas halophila]